MSAISIQNISFHYTSPYNVIFENLSLSLDVSWKTGLVGRNGRGKTTLLRLLTQELNPTTGSISLAVNLFYFPYTPSSPSSATLDVIKESIAPYKLWEKKMDELLKKATDDNMVKYAEILDKYQAEQGYEIDSLIEREAGRLGLTGTYLNRPFDSLSGGEQTRALIIPLFLKNNILPALDEPIDHLDMKGRDLLADYLAQKQEGFLLASHDRFILDACTDHIVSINKSDIRINQGNFSTWKTQMEIEEESERRRNENLNREVANLEEEARKRRKWSDTKEKEKIGATGKHTDKGFISHKATKMMKRALTAERHKEKNLVEKKELLKNYEYQKKLKLSKENRSPDILLSVENISVSFDEMKIINDLSFTVYKNERIAITGENGCGKTTLVNAITGDVSLDNGCIRLPNYVSVARAFQNPKWRAGLLRNHLKQDGIEETRFRNIMAAFKIQGEIFDRPLETFSRGELKKVDLCCSFINPVNLLIWDEPMNYLDIASREQIEEVILEFEPTMLFIDHDRYFLNSIATDTFELPKIN